MMCERCGEKILPVKPVIRSNRVTEMLCVSCIKAEYFSEEVDDLGTTI